MSIEFDKLCDRRRAKAAELRKIDQEIENARQELADGPPAQDVELYQGGLDVTIDFVQRHEPAIGMLEWKEDLPKELKEEFLEPDNDPGDVLPSEPWGSGALLEDNLFLTSGHCFDQFGDARIRPSRKGKTLRPDQLARFMRVRFNFQKPADGQEDPMTRSHVFPIRCLVEYRLGDVDYAIVELDRDGDNKLPNELFGSLTPADQDLPKSDDKKKNTLCVIHHANGQPKVVDSGEMVRNVNGVIAYVDLDTNGGTSGAPILYPGEGPLNGRIVGIHQRGGFTKFGGSSMGVAIGAIRNVSRVL